MTTPQKELQSTIETPQKPPKKMRRSTRLPGGPLWKKLVDTASPAFVPPATPAPPPLESASGGVEAIQPVPAPDNEPRETMQTETAAPKAEPATIITTTVQAAPAPEARSSMLESLFGPKKSTVALYVHPTDPLTGRRMTATMVIAQDEDPEVTATRLATLKPGTYTMIEKNGTQIVSTQTHVVEDSGSTREVSAMAPQPGAAFDPRVITESFAAMMRESQAATAAMMDKMATAQLAAQLDMAKLMLANKSDGGGGGIPPEIIQMLIAKAFAEPAPPQSAVAQIKEVLQLQKLIGGGGEENGWAEAAKGLGPVLAGLIASAQRSDKPAPAAPRRTVSLTGAPQPAAIAETPPAEAVAPTPTDEMAQLVQLIERMASRNAEPEAAIVALSALVDPADFDQITTLITLPGALDQLLAIAPTLAPHRAWLEALAEAILAAAPAEPDTQKGAGDENQ